MFDPRDDARVRDGREDGLARYTTNGIGTTIRARA
jgi:hypothetical protein